MSNAPEQGAAGLRLRFIAPRTAEDLHEVQRLTCFEHEAESHKLKNPLLNDAFRSSFWSSAHGPVMRVSRRTVPVRRTQLELEMQENSSGNTSPALPSTTCVNALAFSGGSGPT
jgi:hypothetical protein